MKVKKNKTCDDLLAQLENHRISYKVGFSAMALFTIISFQDEEGKKIQSILSRYKGKNGKLQIDFEEIASYFESKKQGQAILEEYMKFLIRAFLCECFELVKLYCEETDQFKKIEDEDIIKFLRIIRNSISHNFTIRCSAKDYECKWRSLSFSTEMDGFPLEGKHYGYIEGTFKLWDDLYELVFDKID